MTPADLRTAMKKLGLSQNGLARALRMGANGRQSVGRWIKDGGTIPGPVQVAVELMLEREEWVALRKLLAERNAIACECDCPGDGTHSLGCFRARTLTAHVGQPLTIYP